MKRALYNQPDATPCGSTDTRKRNKTANLLHPFKNGAGKLLLALSLLLASVSAWAQWTDPVSGVTYTPRAGSQGNTNETYDKACDNNSNTKFCLTLNGSAQVTIEASQAVYLKGYTITTANDNSGNAGRNPKNWTVAGSNTQNGTYTTIATVTNDAVLQDLNYAHYTFTCDSKTAYKFYRFTITATRGANVMQFSEFHPIAVTDQNTDFTFSTSYVIHNGTYYAGGEGRDGRTPFNPSTCIWNHNGNLLQNGSRYYLRNNDTPVSTNSSNILFGGNGDGVSSGKTIQLNATRWLTWNTGGYWTRTSNNTQPGTGYLYYLTTYNYSAINNAVNPTISAAVASGRDGIQFSHSDVTGSYRKAYNLYSFAGTNAGTNHYWYDGSDHNTAPQQTTFNNSTPGVNYTWSIVSGEQYATISDAGLLQSRGNATTQQTIRVKLTTTHAASGYTNEQTYDVQIQDHAATTVTAGIGDYNIINTVGGNLQLRGFLNGNYVASYTTYTIGGQSHNLSNGQDYGYNPPQVNAGFEYHWSLGGEGAAYATIASTLANNPQLTYTTDAGHDVVAVVNMYVTHPDIPGLNVVAAPYNVTLYSATMLAPTISYNESTQRVTLSTISEGTTYYTTDGSDPRTSGTRIEYNEPFAVTTSPTTVKACMVRWGNVSAVAEETIRLKLATPTISFNASGVMTVTLPNAPTGTTFRYTTDGTEPTASSALYNNANKPTIGNGQTVKVVAFNDNYNHSDVAEDRYVVTSSVNGTTVVLNDYEDHTWTYYAGVPEEVDGGNYNTKYLGKLYSPNPRNVKITYNGVNGIANSNITVKVSTRTGEGQTSFVYYKTLEEGTTAGQYPYQVISNPFSVRPSTGTRNKTFYGFNGWKIVSGGKYIRGYNDNQTLPLDAEIVFENLDQDVAYTPNCTSAEIVFETTWTQANVQYGGGNVSNAAFNGGNYEKNFCIINANSGALAPTYPVTIMGVEPDGSATYTNTIGGMVTPVAGVANTTKLEYVTWNPGANIDARGRNFTIGRGVTTSGTSRELYGTNQTAGATNIIDQVLKVESGTYSFFRHFTNSGTNCIRKQIVVLGCDYDRAKADNAKLRITGRMIGAEGSGAGNANGNHDANLFMSKTYMKSGTFMTGVTLAGAEWDHAYYLGINSATGASGKRLFEMEGGDLQNSIAGGMDVNMNGTKDKEDYINVYIRIRGGHVKGCIYGAARFAESQGSRQIVMTGGEVNGWIAGGANGNETTQGATTGASYIYIGGNASVGGEGSNTSIGSSIGGCVYGAGCGYGPNSASGNMVLGTNVVVADNAYVERGVYGGGAFGYCATDKTANIYITGGHVEGKSGNYTDRAGTTTNGIIGGVFGGARMRYGGSANIYMTGGWVETGVFGGSNYTGTMEHDVKMVITGGKVGTDATHTGNVHGGGYGQPTRVSGNVDISIGTRNASTGVTSGNAVIYGDVYGGSALGYVNGTTATTTYHTNVTLNAGTIYGSLYGGGLGNASNAANVYGPVQVKVYGGSVKKTDANGANGSGAVYGANNINGAPQRAVTVDIYGTDPAPAQGDYALFSVYGGGNAANYTYGNGYPKVTVHNCENSIEYVYGGGNAAAVAQTDVTIWGGDVIGNVFGGGNGQVTAANVNGATSVKIYGGTIGDVYGGSNTNGTIGGTISVNVNAQAEGGSAACPVNIDNVYGGGNKAASAAGNITIGCIGENGIIGAVYGGANQANITGNISLNITGGRIRSVFGGNNNGGTITGSITVNVDWGSSCSWNYLENVYGGGNKAAYSAPNSDGKNWPKVNIRNAVIEESVFGGGLGESALVTGNPQVTVSTQCPTQGHTNDHMVHIKGSLYGGGSAAPVTGNPVVNTRGLAGDAKKVQIDNHVFGGGFGQTAVVTGNTEVNIKGNTVVNKNVYGGGNGGLVTGNTNIVIGD